MMKGGVQYRTSLFESRQRMQESKVLTDAGDGSLQSGSRMASIEEIDFSHFSYNAVIEIHGCHAGTEVDTEPTNICRRFSIAMYMSGKQLAVAIGHKTRANPNPKLSMVQSHTGPSAPLAGYRESVLSQDYRHGLRTVYFNGRPILATRQPGAIPQTAMVAAIVQSQNAGQSQNTGRSSLLHRIP
jgi:hypothetical protein